MRRAGLEMLNVRSPSIFQRGWRDVWMSRRHFLIGSVSSRAFLAAPFADDQRPEAQKTDAIIARARMMRGGRVEIPREHSTSLLLKWSLVQGLQSNFLLLTASKACCSGEYGMDIPSTRCRNPANSYREKTAYIYVCVSTLAKRYTDVKVRCNYVVKESKKNFSMRGGRR